MTDEQRKIYLRYEQINIDEVNFIPIPLFQNFVHHRQSCRNFLVERPPGAPTFLFSQVIESMEYYYIKNLDSAEKFWFDSIHSTDNNPYIIAVAVNYGPADWLDFTHEGDIIEDKKSVFEFINPIYLADLQSGKAILLLDQSVEGYNHPLLWSRLHDKCVEYHINPAAIIYCTGDQACETSYDAWYDINLPSKNKLKVLPSTSLSVYVHSHYEMYGLKTHFDEILKYKKENSDKLYLYDCVNLRPRPQRVLTFLHLLDAGLINDGNISMPAAADWYAKFTHSNVPGYLRKHGLSERLIKTINYVLPRITPKIAKYKYDRSLNSYADYITRILDDLYRNSWLSIVTESSFLAVENSIFISEKTFKPIACMQPFIIVGSKHSLKYLRKLGYKTFHPFIDESYDDASDELRIPTIMNAITEIKQIKDKAQWYESMRSILEHNYRLFMEIGLTKSREHAAICDYYFKYGGENKNVS